MPVSNSVDDRSGQLEEIQAKKNQNPKTKETPIERTNPSDSEIPEWLQRMESSFVLNISHFSSSEFSEVVSKRTQQVSGEERVTAKSRPMMNWIARSSERTSVSLSFTASESLGKTRHESQSLLSPQDGKYDRKESLVVCSQHTDLFTKQNQNCRQDPDHSCTRWMIKCEGGKKQFSKDATKDSD